MSDKKRSILEKVIKGLSMVGSLAKEGILDFNELSFNAQDYKDILTGRREVTGRDLLKRLHLHEHPEDKDWEPPFIVALAVDIATDPLTYVGGLGLTTKLAKLGLNPTFAKLVGRAILGGGLGLASSDYEDEGLDVIKNIATGMGVGIVAGTGVQYAATKVGKVGTAAIDKYYDTSRAYAFDAIKKGIAKHKGLKVPKVSEAMETMKGVRKKTKKIYMDTMADKQDILNNLVNDTGLVKDDVGNMYFEHINQGGNASMKMRNAAIRGETDKRFKVFKDKLSKTGEKVSKKDLKAHKEILRNDVKREMTGTYQTEANTVVGKDLLNTVDKIGDPALSKAMREYRGLNQKMIDKHNKAFGTNQVPIDWHIADTFKGGKKTFTERLSDDVTEGFKRRAKTDFDTASMSPVDINTMASKRYSKAFMNRAEKVAEVVSRIPDETKAKFGNQTLTNTANGIEAALKGFDAFTRYIKPMHLFTSHKWLQNNYLENNVKAYIMHGPKAGIDVAVHSFPFQGLNKGKSGKLFNEMLEIANPKKGHLKVKFDNEILDVASEVGVIDNNFFSSINETAKENYGLLVASKGKHEADEIMARMVAKGTFMKSIDTFQDFLKNTVGKFGVAVEGTARVKSFEHVMTTALEGNKALKATVDKIGYRKAMDTIPEFKELTGKALKVVNATFHDYGAVNLFEQKVMKRIFPYYTFFSRNLNQTLDNFFEHTGRMSRALKLQTNLGSPPTEEQRKRIPTRLLKYSPRVRSEEADKALKLAYWPNLSWIDALNMLSTTDEQLSKVAPLIKLGAEIGKNKDWFLDSTMGVEGYWENKKPVFDSALPLKMLRANVKERPNRSLYTDDSITAAMISARNTVAPIGIVDQILGTYHNIARKKKPIGETLSKWGPIRYETLSAKQQEHELKKPIYEMKNIERDMNEKMKDKEDKLIWEMLND